MIRRTQIICPAAATKTALFTSCIVEVPSKGMSDDRVCPRRKRSARTCGARAVCSRAEALRFSFVDEASRRSLRSPQDGEITRSTRNPTPPTPYSSGSPLTRLAAAERRIEKAFGGTGQDRGWSVRQTADGGYIIGGETNCTTNTASDVYLIRTDSSGTLQWQMRHGGGSIDIAYCVQPTADGGYIAAGWNSSLLTRSEEFYMLKTDAEGNVEWEKEVGGDGRRRAHCVLQAADGSFIIVGETQPSETGGLDIYLIKLAPFSLVAGSWPRYE